MSENLLSYISTIIHFFQDEPESVADQNPVPEDLEGVVIHQTKRVITEVTERWIRASDMKVLKTTFRTWEGPDNARQLNEDFDEACATTASLPDVDHGNGPLPGDLTSLGAASSSRSSKDSLFKPKRPAGTLHG